MYICDHFVKEQERQVVYACLFWVALFANSAFLVGVMGPTSPGMITHALVGLLLVAPVAGMLAGVVHNTLLRVVARFVSLSDQMTDRLAAVFRVVTVAGLFLSLFVLEQAALPYLFSFNQAMGF
jgi:hypothetical protein